MRQLAQLLQRPGQPPAHAQPEAARVVAPPPQPDHRLQHACEAEYVQETSEAKQPLSEAIHTACSSRGLLTHTRHKHRWLSFGHDMEVLQYIEQPPSCRRAIETCV